MSIVALVLDAGASERSRAVLEGVVTEACASQCAHVGVVLGPDARDVARRMVGRSVMLVLNAAWDEGIASSVRTGMLWASRYQAVVICMCDEPQISTSHLDALIAAHQATGRTVATRHRGRIGAPVVFGSASYPALAALRGDEGPWSLIDEDAVIIDGPASEGLTRQSGAMRSL